LTKRRLTKCHLKTCHSLKETDDRPDS